MAIKPFKRIDNYFAAFSKVRADTIDAQFNKVCDYLNSEILPQLITLNSAKIPGSKNPADINKFLQNTGDYTTRWSFISNASFADYSLDLSKLARSNTGSIIASDAEGVLTSVTPTENNQVLTSKTGNIPAWQKLDASNIEDRSITGTKVADKTITNRNLPSYLIETLIVDNSITGDKFKNNSITTAKIADKTLTIDKLAPELAASFADNVWSNIIPDGYLRYTTQILQPSNAAYQATSWEQIIRLFNDKTRPITKYSDKVKGKPTINTEFPASKFTKYKSGSYFGFSAAHVYGKIHASSKLKANSIDAKRAVISSREDGSFYHYAPRKYMSEIVAKSAVQMQHLTPNLRAKFERARG